MKRYLEGPFGALFLKELRQVRHDRRLILSLIVPPLLQILLFGLALDSEVRNLRVGVVDYSRTSASRDVLSSLTENRSFILTGYYADASLVQKALDRNSLDVGVIIEKDFAKNRARGDQARVQVLLNAVNANVATIAQGYISSTIAVWNQQQSGSTLKQAPVAARVALLFNPGLISAWFMVTGTMAILIILNGSIVASTALIKEKESGTVEQLLMTPATSQEVVLAKIAPIFLLLMGMVAIVFVFAKVVFQIPVRGNGLLLTAAFALCALAGIGIGTMLATLSRSAQQTQLLTLFINPPLAVLSGSLTPIEAMPGWLQPITLLNPVRHFVTVARGILLKGAGLDVLWPNLLFLVVFT
ncbi:MAG: ABC transporter permease, partial [Bryobacteraceae bacterium]|nr:ABC transporter permease [Bryobacteraceae bacterium]